MATIYTQTGENVIVDLIDGTSTEQLLAANAHIAWGVGAATAAKGSTGLQSETTEGGVDGRISATVTQPASDKNQWVATLEAVSTHDITEAGLFNSTAYNTSSIIIHGDFTAIALASTGDKIEFTVSLEQT